MVFSSLEFIFLFLPLTLIVAGVLERRGADQARLGWLALASLGFYGYWDLRYLALIGVSIVINFAVARRLAAVPGRWLLAAGVAFNLGLLGYYKYANFLVDNLNRLTDGDLLLKQIVLPIGISFFTFQQVAYLVDTHQKKVSDSSFLRYCLFVCFFPQLIAGPIVHHAEMMPQFARGRVRDPSFDFAVGATIFALGLFKKVILADSVAPVADTVFDGAARGIAPPAFEAWLGTLAYTLQIYFDFSGYSDMAIGLGRLFGIRLPINFASPYKATSIVDFWRRWHITLSRFLRDYLYVPLGGNRKGKIRRLVNVFVTMVLGGIWHGAGWTFLLWGALHGTFLMINQAFARMGGWRPPGFRVFSHALTLCCVVAAWIPFRAADLTTTLTMYQSLVGQHGLIRHAAPPEWFDAAQLLTEEPAVKGIQMSIDYPLALPLLCILFVAALILPNTQEFVGRYRPGIASPGYPATRWPFRPTDLRWRPDLLHALGIGVTFAWAVFAIRSHAPFIYFQF